MFYVGSNGPTFKSRVIVGTYLGKLVLAVIKNGRLFRTLEISYCSLSYAHGMVYFSPTEINLLFKLNYKHKTLKGCWKECSESTKMCLLSSLKPNLNRVWF